MRIYSTTVGGVPWKASTSRILPLFDSSLNVFLHIWPCPWCDSWDRLQLRPRAIASDHEWVSESAGGNVFVSHSHQVMTVTHGCYHPRRHDSGANKENHPRAFWRNLCPPIQRMTARVLHLCVHPPVVKNTELFKCGHFHVVSFRKPTQ